MKFKNFLKQFSGRARLLIFLAYVLIFLLVFSSARHGLGMFWDWSWPLFKDHLGVLFTSNAHSWTDQLLGRPMLYNSSYYFSYLLSLLKYSGLQPETALYLFLSLTAAATSFGVYIFAKRKLNVPLSFLFGLLAVLNPAYFYKLMAGHTSYLISIAIFVYFIYFLSHKFKNNFKSALILGLLLAFAGAQIQFFIFAFIVLAICYILNYGKFKFRYLISALVLALLINLPWLSNFLVGANQVSQISGQAGNIAFEGATRASILRIATLSFSDATLLKYFYSKYIFAYFGLFSLGLFALVIWRLSKPKIPKEFWQIFIVLIIFVFLGTGIYQNWNIPVIKTLYPMLRESGHLAPVIVLFMILLLVRLWPEKSWLKWPIIGYLVIFVVINIVTIFSSAPTLNYTALRARLAPYKEFLDKDSSTYRIAAYPFFGQYSVAGEANKEVRGQPVRNTGIDVFTQNSTYDALSNYIPAQQLDQSVQYKFLETLDLSLLEERNIKYLLDFSGIYQSNVEKYSDSSYYHDNLSFIKNDLTLFRRLLAKYPNRLNEVAPHIYELTQSVPRVEVGGRGSEATKVNPSLYEVQIKGFSDNTKISFYSSFHQGWKLRLEDNHKEVAADSHTKIGSLGQSWFLHYQDIKKDAQNAGTRINDDGSIDLNLELYFAPEKYFVISKYLSIITIILTLAGIVFLSHKKFQRE